MYNAVNSVKQTDSGLQAVNHSRQTPDYYLRYEQPLLFTQLSDELERAGSCHSRHERATD